VGDIRLVEVDIQLVVVGSMLDLVGSLLDLVGSLLVVVDSLLAVEGTGCVVVGTDSVQALAVEDMEHSEILTVWDSNLNQEAQHKHCDFLVKRYILVAFFVAQ